MIKLLFFNKKCSNIIHIRLIAENYFIILSVFILSGKYNFGNCLFPKIEVFIWQPDVRGKTDAQQQYEKGTQIS